MSRENIEVVKQGIAAIKKAYAKDDIAPWRQQVGPILDRISAAATAAGAIVIDPVPFVCDDGVCPVIGPAGEPTHADRGHMRPWYVIQRATFLDRVLRDPRVR